MSKKINYKFNPAVQITPNKLIKVDKDGTQTWVGSVTWTDDDGKQWISTRYLQYNPRKDKQSLTDKANEAIKKIFKF